MKPLVIPDLETRPVLSRAQKAAIVRAQREESLAVQEDQRFSRRESLGAEGSAYRGDLFCRPLASILH